MISFALRFAGFGVALILALLAWESWRTGAPPPWSLLAERVEAHVIEARVESGRISTGTMRHTPVVVVDRGAGPVALEGLKPSFYDHRQDKAEAIVADYTPGGVVQVRVVDGVAMADRQDIFQTAHATFMSLMALVVAGIGVVMFMVFGPDRKPRAAES